MNPAEYDAWYDTPRGRWIGETEYRLLQGLVTPNAGESLLDVGCGTGWFSRRFAAAGLDVTGVDVDADALAWARARPGPRVRYLSGDARRLPFPDRSFDRVISVAALCFIEDWRVAMAEIARVARLGFAVGLLNRRSLLWLDKGRRGGRGAYRGAHWHEATELRDALAALPTEKSSIRSAVFIPSGSRFARTAERLLSSNLPWGGFLAVSGATHAPR